MISSQMPLPQKISRADHVVWNNGPLSNLEAQAAILARFLAANLMDEEAPQFDRDRAPPPEPEIDGNRLTKSRSPTFPPLDLAGAPGNGAGRACRSGLTPAEIRPHPGRTRHQLDSRSRAPRRRRADSRCGRAASSSCLTTGRPSCVRRATIFSRSRRMSACRIFSFGNLACGPARRSPARSARRAIARKA